MGLREGGRLLRDLVHEAIISNLKNGSIGIPA
jgi:hypothetical protein